MLCDVCRNGLEGMWDHSKTPRLGLRSEWFPTKGPQPFFVTSNPVPSPEAPLDPPEVEKYVYAHHLTKGSFLQSMKLGCVMCNRFRPSKNEALYPLNSGEVVEEATKAGYFSVFYVMMQAKKLVMFVRYGDTVGGFSLMPFEEDTNLTCEMDDSTDGPRARGIIDKWVNNCVRNHEHCKESGLQGFLPTRLLAIDGSGEPKTFRLVLGSECPPNSQYMTLSHCWGTKPLEGRLRLLQSTFDQLCEDHPIDALPKTFREAMTVTLRFGLKYLWIDCLCIFQDNPEDWHIEASSMQQVYKNSFLGVSALGAADDEGGLFHSRNAAQPAPTIVQLKCSEDGELEPFLFELEKGWAWRLSWSPEPIVSRAWVIQERLLPPRVVHFGRKQVFWECREQNACEVHPETVYCFGREEKAQRKGEKEKEPKKPHLWKQLLDAPDRRPVYDSYEQLFVDWNAIMHIYTKCKLTIASDKLVALSGIADDMKRALEALRPGPHSYLAGIWEERLREGLCWSVIDSGKRPERYRAPSWSWASVDGNTSTLIVPPKEENTVWFIDKCTATTELLGEQDTGEVTGGMLTVEGPWTRVHLGDVEGLGLRRHMNNRRLLHFEHLESGERSEVESGALSTGQRFGGAIAYFDVVDEMPAEAFCVPFQASVWTETVYSVSAILLVKAEGMEGEVYRRIGFVSAIFKNRERVMDFFGVFPKKIVTVI